VSPRATIAAALAVSASALALTACGGSEPERAAVATAASPTPAAAPAVVPTTTIPATPQPRDSEEAQSHPLPDGQRGTTVAAAPTSVKAAAVAATADTGISPGAATDDEVRKQLQKLEAASAAEKKAAVKTGTGSRATVASDGQATAPADAPEAVTRIIGGGNAIAKFPYVYGGGHGSFVDTAYDCSGSLSYALAAAGLLRSTMTSGELAKWGASGPGKWVTIYANDTHTFMYVAGLRFDTSGRSGTFGTRWQTAPRSTAGFVVRHPAGL
jgi:hypothetical protein